jgi:hypothetical protein
VDQALLYACAPYIVCTALSAFWSVVISTLHYILGISELNIAVTLAIFHSKGTVALIMAILKIFVNEVVITGAAMRIILAGILSIPVDLRGFRDNRSLYTFDSDTV